MALEAKNTLPEDFGQDLADLKQDIRRNPEMEDPKMPYTIEKIDWGVSLQYIDKDNLDNNWSFIIKKTATGKREISELHEWILSEGDLADIVLNAAELSNDENINYLTKVLKKYELPLLTAEQVIELSLQINTPENNLR